MYVTLYHGSNVVVRNPCILKPNHTLDFGAGFYTTSNRKQAEDFAVRVTRNRALQLYVNGAISRDYTLQRLKVKELFNQLVFKTDRALTFLRFVSSEVVHG